MHLDRKVSQQTCFQIIDQILKYTKDVFLRITTSRKVIRFVTITTLINNKKNAEKV